MADVRVGRYVRDNRTGDWCIITRSHRDHVTRLQYVRVRNDVARERICLTCDTNVFDKGDILASVLFRCHDKELRTCPCAMSCRCQLPVRKRVIKGLEDAALSVMQEGAACWKGKVRVTVLNHNTHNGDIDECMDVTSSVQPTMDNVLASQMARLAIIEKVNSATYIPRPITSHTDPEQSETTAEPQHNLPLSQIVPNVANVSMDSFDNVFMQSETEVADHFLIPPENNVPVLDEVPMLPADPSTLPGGVEMCLDGMDLEDDWCSFINSDRDANSGTSAQSNSNLSQTAPIHKSELLPLDLVDSSRGKVEEEDPYDGYHGCATAALSSVPSARNQVPAVSSPVMPPPLSLQQQLDQPLREPPPEVFLPLRADPKISVLPKVIPEQKVASQQPVAPKQSPPRVPETGMPRSAPQMFPAHVFPMLSTPQPWQQPFQPPKMTAQQEDSEISPTGTPGEMENPMGRGCKLAPRPAGMNVADGFIWQMGNAPNQYALAARLEAMEKERRAEDRRKKNRQAAARSNERKKNIMDGIRAEIRETKEHEARLRQRKSSLQEENQQLRERAGRIGLAM